MIEKNSEIQKQSVSKAIFHVCLGVLTQFSLNASTENNHSKIRRRNVNGKTDNG